MKLQGFDSILQKGLKHNPATPPLLPISNVSCKELLYFEHCYPVVFTTDETPKLVALLGLSNGKNLVKFSREYPPTFASILYPFVVEIKDDTPMLFYVEDEKFLSPNGVNVLFDEDKKPTRFMEQIIKKATAYANDLFYTGRLAKDILNAGIFVSKQIEIENNDKKAIFKDFLIVDREKLNALDDKTMLYFAKNGHLELIYLHLKSLMRMENFVNIFKDNSR